MSEVVTGSGGEQRRVVHSETRKPAEVIAARIVYWVFGLIEVIIALRFVLRLLGANPDAGFTQIILNLSALPMAPFLAVFPAAHVKGSVFELSALLAILIYALIAWGIVALIRAASPRESAGTVEESTQVENSGTARRS